MQHVSLASAVQYHPYFRNSLFSHTGKYELCLDYQLVVAAAGGGGDGGQDIPNWNCVYGGFELNHPFCNHDVSVCD